MASIGKALEWGFVKKGRFKVGETTLGQVKKPAIDRITEQEPATVSTLGMNKIPSPYNTTSVSASSDSIFREVKEHPAAAKKIPFAKTPSGVALAVPNGSTGHGNRQPIRSPSGVTLAYRNSPQFHPVSLPPLALDAKEEAKKAPGPLQGLADAIEVLGSTRGIGWDFGEGLYVPPHTRPLERGPFLKATIKSFFISFFIVDFIESFLKVIPGFAFPASGSIFFADSPPSFLRHTSLWPWIQDHYQLASIFTKYTVSTLLTFSVGVAIIAGFIMCYDILTLVCVGGLGHNPESWPPIFDHPWLTTSLADFWGRRWHQTLRQTFFCFGGYPLQYVVNTIARPLIGAKKAKNIGRIALVLGTFIASGLFHGLSIYSMGHGGVDHTATRYFATQGVFLLLERAFRITTGIRVRGWWGRLWAYLVVLGGIQTCGTCLSFSSLRLALTCS